MQIITSGILMIVANKHFMEFELNGFESGFDPYETLETLDFDYAKIFEMVCGTLEKDGYEIPSSEEDFHHSPLWKELGFEVNDDFKIIRIDKDISVENYMSYGQNASFIIDFESKTVEYNEYYRYRNAVDNLIFEWSCLFDEEGDQLNGSDVLDKLADVYYQYRLENITAKELYDQSRKYILSLHLDDGIALTNGYVEDFFKVIRQYVEQEV